MPLVVILGMHRSGTSFLTHRLNAAGLSLGEKSLLRSGYDNLEGFWESPEPVAINDRILELSGGAWHTVPPRLHIDDQVLGRMQAFLDGIKGHRVAGWKDPRTTLTFPLWKPHLSDYRIVAAVRHPLNVARSLQVRQGWPLERGLQLWADYNEHLLRTTSEEMDVLWFNFDQTPDDIRSTIRGICKSLDLDSDASVEGEFNQFLRHHNADETIADPRIADLYQALCERFRQSRAEYCASNTCESVSPQMIGDHNSLAARIDQLARVQSLEDASVQQLYAKIDAVQAMVNDLKVRFDGLQSLIAETEAVHEETRLQQDAIDRERRSVLFEMTRISSNLARVQALEDQVRAVRQAVDGQRLPLVIRIGRACLQALAHFGRFGNGDTTKVALPGPQTVGVKERERTTPTDSAPIRMVGVHSKRNDASPPVTADLGPLRLPSGLPAETYVPERIADTVPFQSQPWDPKECLVGCVAENNETFLRQAVRFAQALRWFGGSLSAARLRICVVEGVESTYRQKLESLGAEVRIVPRFHERNPFANKLQFFNELDWSEAGMVMLLDCDTAVVRDPLPFLVRDAFQAKIADKPTVHHEVFERVFRKYNIKLPPRSYVTDFDSTPTIPYCNSGVLFIPSDVGRRLIPAWRDWNNRLADEMELLAPCAIHCNQASLAVALAETAVPFRAVDRSMNYPLHMTQLAAPSGFFECDPCILHYHQCVDQNGLLNPVPYPKAQLRIDAFNARLQQDVAEAQHCAIPADSPRYRASDRKIA